ncbi:MAG: hypothetical protein JOS17DRAFT_740388 [Linnemannia elongata]|nr:MAG: hypothetical protein JOS17DRAFT_740388 [Linnemannia elongata]
MIHDNASQATDLSSVKVVSRQASIRSIKPSRMSILDNVFFCAFLCAVGGCAAAAQGSINAQMGKYSGKGLSSTLVFCIGAVTSFIYFLIEVRGRPPANLAIMLAKAPIWAWTGGVLGAVYVTITILSIPTLGAGTTTAILISAKLIFSCIIDHFGLFGINKRPFTIFRALAALGLVGCVAVIAAF